jgi:hypothetical protein
MRHIPFTVTHDGRSATCALHVNAKGKVALIEFRTVRNQGLEPLGFAAALREKIELLNDLIAAEMPFDALATCRRSPGLFGAIIDPATSELENFRAGLLGGGDAA